MSVSRAGSTVALISSGLGYTERGIEVWMTELADHLGARQPAELWGGGRRLPPTRAHGRSLHGIGRDSKWWAGWSWSRRYLWEQLSVVLQTVWQLRRHRISVAYCGDPALSWHLKRFAAGHGARVVFLNGMRLSARWAKVFDGVHLLAPPYLEQARREVGDQAAQRFFVVPHFVETDRFRPASEPDKAAARAELGLPVNAFVIVTVGPVGTASGKRLDFLAGEVAGLRGESLLVSAGPAEEGAGEVRARCASLLKSSVRFLGRVAHERVPCLLRAADVYSLGSLAEPFSIAILEAMATGLPVVHHPDAVMSWQTGEGGVPVSMTERGRAAEAFDHLRRDPGYRAKVSRAARVLAETRYAPGPVCDRLAAQFRLVAGGMRGGEARGARPGEETR